ncbi:MAG: choice-of-anchor Q domain-containing protein [Anaerolineae bacterium]|nr:choice-of-anchor Q domain-containing protein [Anaerolineae bacterium]
MFTCLENRRTLSKLLCTLAVVVTLAALAASGVVTSEAHSATFVVDSTADDGDQFWGDGECATALDECTLRAALDETFGLYQGFYGPPDLDTHIIQVPGGNYNVGSSLGVGGNVLIQGAGWQSTIISASAVDYSVVMVNSGITAEIEDLTISNGNAYTGGGLWNEGTLTLRKTNLVGNSTSIGNGGGIRNWGDLTLEDCYIASNSAVQGGGGIANENGAVLIVQDSSIASNTTSDLSYGGGAIYNASSGTVDIVRSSIRDNTAPMGGGIFNYGIAWLTNVTVSGNGATTTGTNGGGGVNNQSGATLDLKSVTIANNSTTTGQALVNIGTLNVAHTIVADNSGGDCFLSSSGTLDGTVHHNLDSDGSCFSAGDGNLPNTDPMLTSLLTPGYYGAHGLLPGSPAIDAGDPAGCLAKGSLLLTDQRGRSRTVDGDDDGTAVCDIGAFEAQIKTYLPLIQR